LRQSVRQIAPNLEVPQTDLAESLISVIFPACFCLNRGEDSQPAPSSYEIMTQKPVLRIRDIGTDPDPAIFGSDLKDGN
jgi:hypothetical protein